MEQIIKIVFAIAVGVITFTVLTKIGNGTTVEMTSGSNYATMTTTDYFGNKQTCRTTVFYGSSRTSCD